VGTKYKEMVVEEVDEEETGQEGEQLWCLPLESSEA
jgi:hypothetical protein